MLSMLRRAGLDLAYLSLALLTSILALVVWTVALSLSLSLAVLIVGLPVALASAYVMRWTAELDRRNAALVFGRPVRGAYRSHRADTWFGRLKATLGDPQTWKDLGWLIVHSALGMAFGIIAISLVGTVLGLATLPAWYWSIPEGVEFGLWDADSLPVALASSLLAIPLAYLTRYTLRGMARFHASLAVELLGRRPV